MSRTCCATCCNWILNSATPPVGTSSSGLSCVRGMARVGRWGIHGGMSLEWGGHFQVPSSGPGREWGEGPFGGHEISIANAEVWLGGRVPIRVSTVMVQENVQGGEAS